MRGTEKSSQGKFYKIQYLDNGLTETKYIERNLKNGAVCWFKDNRKFKVLKQVKFKYTYEDIANLRDVMLEYNIGSVQYNLGMRMQKSLSNSTPAITFSYEERDIMRELLIYDNGELTDNQKITLRKVLNIT